MPGNSIITKWVTGSVALIALYTAAMLYITSISARVDTARAIADINTRAVADLKLDINEVKDVVNRIDKHQYRVMIKLGIEDTSSSP
jgi:hypothetical protein